MGFEVSFTEKGMHIVVPTWRSTGDVSIKADIMEEVARMLADCGVNDLLLSVDAFHQETIPLETVKAFVTEAKRCGIPTRLQPAWLVSREDENPYNMKTREILDSFAYLDLPIGSGNVIFPEGNALLYLAEYFTGDLPENPYVDDPFNIKTVSFSPNGDVLDANVYKKEITDILADYNP